MQRRRRGATTRIVMSIVMTFTAVAVGADDTGARAAGTIPITGDPVPGLEPFDELFTTFLAEHSIPGASVCISRDGEIIYARGFGYGNVEAGLPVEPDSLFRIASVSKPITAAAIMQLVDAGKLSLEENPFAVLGYEETLAGDDVDARLRDVTIRQVLHHTAGWDRDASFDPMFQYRRIADAMGVACPPSQRAIIEFMLEQPLDFDPGARYSYSNFGYCVLGRVIEAVSEQTYERYVQEHIFRPLGVEAPRIGRSLPEDRCDREVCYYDSKARDGAPIHAADRRVPLPYTLDHEVMDSHGAWIASAIDLVRFADAFNDPDSSPLLSAEAIEAMFAPPAGSIGHDEEGDVRDVYYGFGWSVRPVRGVGRSANTWHMGRISGTSTLLVRRHDGLNWAVLFNTDQSAAAGGGQPAGLIDSLMHQAAARVEKWPGE